jgi:hypothetical protein
MISFKYVLQREYYERKQQERDAISEKVKDALRFKLNKRINSSRSHSRKRT